MSFINKKKTISFHVMSILFIIFIFQFIVFSLFVYLTYDSYLEGHKEKSIKKVISIDQINYEQFVVLSERKNNQAVKILLKEIKKKKRLQEIFYFDTDGINELIKKRSELVKCKFDLLNPSHCYYNNEKSLIGVYPVVHTNKIFGYLVQNTTYESPAFYDQKSIYFYLVTILLIIFILNALGIIYYFKYYINRDLGNLKKLISLIEKDKYKNIDINITEYDEIKNKFLTAWTIIKKHENDKIKLKSELENKKMYEEIAHDIKAPLATLKMTIDSLDNIQEDEKILIERSIERIENTASYLLAKRKNASLLPKLIELMVAEKRIQYGKRTEINIDAKLIENSSNLYSVIDKSKFNRALSIFIDNAIQAIKGKGNVIITAYQDNGNNIILIEDDGCGISPHILDKLGKKEILSQKKDGNGIGVLSAVGYLKEMNGSLEIVSKINKGTIIKISIPNLKESTFSAKNIDIDSCIVLIDDDELVRMSWEMDAEKLKINLKTFEDVESFYSEFHNFDKNNTTIYIDSDLGNNIKGELEAKKIYAQGFKQIFMATGHRPEKFEGVPWIEGVGGKYPPWSKLEGQKNENRIH